MDQIEIIRRTIKGFCLEFIKNPYLCYTEHGLHALFYSKLFNAFLEEERYTNWLGNRVCVIQKEYPTAEKLGKSQRQHWDISIIKTPPESKHPDWSASYDYLKLAAVIEFGMNEGKEHLKDDIERVCHRDANVEHEFIIHLCRLSNPGAKFSKRDGSPKSAQLLSKEDVAEIVSGKPTEVYYGMKDSTFTHNSGVWLINQGEIKQI
ncbi:MAG: hypothetical protein U9Q82_04500 [Chloroflexota bacterium]|nr:hypothetical protein [Chloroflexota bacterium]